MRVFDRRYELMDRPQLEQLQLERLQALLVRLKRYVRRYREQMADSRVESLADLAKLPETTPEEMAESFPYGMFALPLREVIQLHSTTGPQGKPLIIGHTRNDLAQWGRLVARQLAAGGATANDVVQVCFGADTYVRDAGYVLGAELIEATVVAEEPFHIDHQLSVLKNYRPTVLITTPTNAQDLIRIMDLQRIDPPSLHLRTVLLTRPVDESMREEMRAGLHVVVQCNFGIDEILDPGLCVECEAGHFHVNEDQFLVETVDGELLVTTLCREAMPLLRYRTRVACILSHEKCSCGRTGVMLEPGERLDGRLRVRETPLYEGQIAEVLKQTPVAGHRCHIDIEEQQVVVSIEMSEDLFSDMMWPLENLRHQIASEVFSRLGIQAEVRYLAPRRER